MAAAPDDLQGTLVGQRIRMSRNRFVFFVVFYLGYAVWGVFRHRYEIAVLVLLAAGVLVVLMVRPPTVVEPAGIRRPWRMPAVVSWSEVASVAAPELGVPGVGLTLTSGKTVRLRDISASNTRRVASIGGKEVLDPPPLRVPPRAPAIRSDTEIAADVDRRAKALSDEWRRLDAQFPRRPPPPPG